VAIEYEHETPALEQDVALCADYFRACAALSPADLLAGKALAPGMSWEPRDALANAPKGEDGKWPPAEVPLFKADLSDAIFKEGSWAFDQGVLTAKGEGDIWTKARYGDFVLDLEFRCETNTNSGVFLRCADIANWLHTAIEVQILQPDAENKKHTCGGIFDCLEPSKQMVKPAGEWNRFVITAKANRIEVVLNGEKVVDMDLDRWPEAHKNPDGTPNKFNTAYKDMAREGHVGLQYHGAPVSFRNMRIKKL
jgi:hypothetical protein